MPRGLIITNAMFAFRPADLSYVTLDEGTVVSGTPARRPIPILRYCPYCGFRNAEKGKERQCLVLGDSEHLRVG